MAHLPATDEPSPSFLFATCGVGAERALKTEMARLWPELHFAYSRPGFVTFKLPAGHSLTDDFDPRAVFARTHGFSLGKTAAAELFARVAHFWRLAGERPYDALHVWQRDAVEVGFRGFEPHITPAAHEAEAAIRAAGGKRAAEAALKRIAQPGDLVLDCILVEPHEWWIGYHRATDAESCLPGGLRELSLPADAVSRAYLKMEEALAWSGLPIKPGQTFAELGCAPGGASQALLNRGLKVLGIDPAAVDPRVLALPRFKHVRKRGADMRRREFSHVDWLAADMNVAPMYTLDTVEGIVTHPAVNIRGLLLTLKLPNWDLAEEIPAYLDRVASWGYTKVRARQLVHNRQEICVAAIKRKSAARR